MSGFELRIPHRDPDAPILDAVDDLRDAIDDDEERAVVRTVLVDLYFSGSRSVGDVLHLLGGETPSERRARVDAARAELGLDTITEIEQRQQVAEATRWPPPMPTRGRRDENGAAIQECAHPDCTRLSADDFGNPAPSRARRWWCEAHRAGHEDDLEPHSEQVRFSEGGGFRMSEEAERFEAQQYERLIAQTRERAEARREEAGVVHRARERYKRDGEPINVTGFKVRPDGVIVDA